jgi:type I restriction enzyme, S subunit
MIAEQLKRSILQAAIQGKLTEQLPDDGDARDLLKEIQKEKALLFKDGKIKKETWHQEIKEDELPFDIPENWCWVRLGNVILQNVGGGTPSKSNPDYWNGSIAWASVKDLNCKFLSLTQDYISEAGLNNSSTNLIPKGNIIVCTRMGLGKIVYNTIDVAINQDLRALFFSEKISKWYIYYFYLTLNMNGKGATVKGISVEDLSNALLPFPPFAEQCRIVERLEEVLLEIAKLENDESKLDVLQKAFPRKMKDSILQYAIQGKLTEQLESDGDARDLLKEIQKEKALLFKEGKIKEDKPLPEITEDEIPFDIPKNWCWVRLGELTRFISKGTTPSGGKNAYKCSGIGFIRAENVDSDGKVNLNNLMHVDEVTHNTILKRSILEAMDLLICIAGTLGRSAVVEAEQLPLNTNQAVSIARLADTSKISVYYLQKAIGAFSIQKYLLNQTKVTAIPNLTLEIINKCIIPLPPLSEQERIVKRLEKLLPEIDILENRIQA